MLEINQLAAGYGEKKFCMVSAFCLKADNYCILGPNGCGKTTLIRDGGLIRLRAASLLMDSL